MAKKKVEWTPQMQFSKRIARVILIYWLIFVTGTFAFLVFMQAVDAILALTGWVTAVMITMIAGYTGNSVYEKHLDKGMGKGFYNIPLLNKNKSDDKEEKEDGDSNNG